MTKKDHQKIVQDLLKKMGFSVETEKIITENGEVINIKSEDPSLLIGRGGGNLASLQHIINLLVYSSSAKAKSEKIFLDINQYRQQQKENLRSLAERIAKKVVQSGQVEVLQPMSAYERKTIHLYLADFPDIMTESIGEEPNRRVVVRIRK